MNVKKRNGLEVEYDGSKIVLAMQKAMKDVDYVDSGIPSKALEIEEAVRFLMEKSDKVWSVEDVSDEVEMKLMEFGLGRVAKEYILFRQKQSKIRNMGVGRTYKYLSKEFISKYKHADSPFINQLGEFVYYRTYSRYLEEQGRREDWWETVARATDYNIGLVKHKSHAKAVEEAELLFDNMFHLKQFLSGRTLFTGGTKVSKEYGMSNYNCSFTVIDSFEAYKDLFYLLMIGAGVGYRVLKQDVLNMPKIRTDIQVFHNPYTPIEKHKRQEYTSLVFTGETAEIFISDSKEAWTDSLYKFLELHFSPQYKKVKAIVLNYNNIRPKGERLVTFGGYSSGYESMQKMLLKIDTVLKSGTETLKQLTTLECSDIANIIGENVVSGGVRRTAEVCLFDADDQEIMNCKSNLYQQNEEGDWVVNTDILHRQMSNNSIQYWEKPTEQSWHEHIEAMRYSGEPGFQNMVAARLRRIDAEGGNPCMEIILRSKGVCNLTEVNVLGFVENGVLDEEALLVAQRISARSGYRMASIEFELSEWNKINKEDMLTGCSLTGWQDMVSATNMTMKKQSSLLKQLKDISIKASKELANELGTNVPKLNTTIKPSGTLSQLPTVSNGVHWSHSPYYIRRVRISAQDPLARVAKDLGWTWTPEVGQTVEDMSTMVIEFYVKSPNGKTKYDVSAIEQLETYKMFMEDYADHNVSITVHVRDNEWGLVEKWCYENWDILVAISFLPLDDSFYDLLPYEAITKEQYEELSSKQRRFSPSLLLKYETNKDSDIDSDCYSGACPVR